MGPPGQGPWTLAQDRGRRDAGHHLAAGRHAIVCETFFNRHPVLYRLTLAGPLLTCAYALVELARAADARGVRGYGSPAALMAVQLCGLARMRPGGGRQA